MQDNDLYEARDRNSKNFNDDYASQQVKGWNWGAFMFSVLWGFGNKVYLPLLVFVPFLNIIWFFVCGAKGNEWAWKANSHKYESIYEFQKVQETWNRAGFVMFIIQIVAFILLLILIFFVGASSSVYYNYGY